MKISLRHLLYIQMINKHQNYARAAEALNVTQPTLSKSILALEKQLDLRIFDRSSKKVTPTEFGRHILRYSDSILNESNRMERELDMIANLDMVKLKIGFGYLAAEMFLAESYSRMAAAYPEITIQSSIAWATTLLDELLRGDLDVLICDTRYWSKIDNLEITELPNHSACYVCRPDHPLHDKPDISLTDIFDYPIYCHRLPEDLIKEMSRLSRRKFTSVKDFPNGVMEGPYHLTADVVGKSNGVGIGIEPIYRKQIDLGVIKPLAIDTPTIASNYAFVILKDRTIPIAVQVYKKAIVDIGRELNNSSRQRQESSVEIKSRT